MKAMCFDWCA